MAPTVENVNILIHGLFFMTRNPGTNNLVIYAPIIPKHLFVGGVRGRRIELTNDIDWSNIDLLGGTPQWESDDPNHERVPTDVKGTIMQFTKSETGVGDLKDDPTLYKGKIILPWPAEWYSLRRGDINTTFKYKPTSIIGSKIERNAMLKSKKQLGIVTCLRYGYASMGLPGWARHLNIHFYLQPCQEHSIDDVNHDLATAALCFKNQKQFDLEMINDPGNPIPPIDPGKYDFGDVPPGVTPEDEQSLYEDPAPDTLRICQANVTPSDAPPSSNDGSGSSPANCPNFYVGP